MIDLLAWRSAVRGDRPQLDTFKCTRDPVKSLATRWKPYHPKWWELEVQSAIRGLEPPYAYPRQLLVGLDRKGVAAVSYFEEVDGPARVELSLMALATRLRSKEKGHAEEMFRVTRELIENRAIEHGHQEVELVGYVWHENLASQRMCADAGLKHTDFAADGVHVWTARVMLGTPDDEWP